MGLGRGRWGASRPDPIFSVDHLVRLRPRCRWDWTPRVPWRPIGGVAPHGPGRPGLDGPVAGARRQRLPGVTDDPRSGFCPSEPAFRRAPTDPGDLGPWGRTIMDRGRGPRGARPGSECPDRGSGVRVPPGAPAFRGPGSTANGQVTASDKLAHRDSRGRVEARRGTLDAAMVTLGYRTGRARRSALGRKGRAAT